VTPFFCRHSRTAAKRAGPPLPGAEAAEPVEEVPVEVELLAEALVLEDVPPEEPPHAVRQTHASSRISRAPAACLRLAVLVWGIELLCR
jgi:hypothetical protein